MNLFLNSICAGGSNVPPEYHASCERSMLELPKYIVADGGTIDRWSKNSVKVRGLKNGEFICISVKSI